MRFEINREKLLKGLQAVNGAVEKLQTMPILSHVLINAANDALQLTGTDLRLELLYSCPADIKNAGSVAVNARKLLEIVRSLPDNSQLKAEAIDGRITISTANSRFVLSTMSADEFPATENLSDQICFSMEQAALRTLIERSHFAMAHEDDPRRYLSGLLMVVQKNRLRCVATDGHRLALSELAVNLDSIGNTQIIIPRKSVQEIVRLLANNDDSVNLSLAGNNLRIEVGELRITTKLLEGRYPDYERVIPQAGDKCMIADRETARQALTRTAILAKERFKGVRLSLSPGNLKLQVQNQDQEESEENLAVNYDGEPIEIGFNVVYLLDALNAMDKEQFRLELSTPDASGLLTEEGDENARYVVMPMRL